MWFCSNCRNEMEEKFGHCWQCGAKRVVGSKPRPQTTVTSAIPKFESYEELAKVPTEQPLLLRLILRPNLLRRPLLVLVMFLFLGLLKFLDSPFLSKYGLYLVIVGGILGLVFILWGHFRRDPGEGSGIKLN